jgi:hypothetical protein
MPSHAGAPDGAAGTPDGAAGRVGHPGGDRRWPRPARLLVAVALLPVWAAVILAAENDLAFLGQWFDPLMIALMLATVIAVWVATGRSQR